MNKKPSLKDELKRVINEAEPGDQKVMMAGLVCTGIIIVLALLWTFDIWEDAILILAPLAGIQMLIQMRLRWKNQRKSAIMYLILAVFFLAASALLIFAAIR